MYAQYVNNLLLTERCPSIYIYSFRLLDENVFLICFSSESSNTYILLVFGIIKNPYVYYDVHMNMRIIFIIL